MWEFIKTLNEQEDHISGQPIICEEEAEQLCRNIAIYK